MKKYLFVALLIATLTLGFSCGNEIVESQRKITVASVISAEACGEGVYGMWAVANTIQNRMELRNKTAYEIVTEPFQYSGYKSKNRLQLYYECQTSSLRISEHVGRLEDITNGAIFFKTPQEKRQPWHKIFTVKIGNHEFYKN